MNLQKLIFTNNDCYKKNRSIIPCGIMVHSTGANNPWLKRYVGPDDGKLGKNKNNNHWNVPGLSVCVHAFIGKLQDGSIATYQTLPWTHRGWHCGKGKKGSGNNGYISFEICEDGLSDAKYFAAVYQEAVELCAYLCKKFSLDADAIICHSEGHEMGIASNHGDVMHWFPKHGKTMDDFRRDVQTELDCVAGFVDVPHGVYYEAALVWAKRAGIVYGIDASHLGPTLSCTRAQIVTMLWRLAGTPNSGKKIPFTDVRSGAFYETAVRWAYANGIIEGITPTTFCPDAACTRAQIVAMIGRQQDDLGTTVTHTPFEDVDPGAYYHDALLWAYQHGVAIGVDQRHFAPGAEIRRCDAIAMLYRRHLINR